MPAARKVTLPQMELMLSFMEEHRALARGQSLDTSQGKVAVRQQWEELAARLNAVMGHLKTGTQWRNYWRDCKYRVKKKVGEQEVHRRGTGGGPPSAVVLTPVEERIFSIIGKQAVLGDEEVRIPFDLQEEIAPPPSPPMPDVEVEVEIDCTPAFDMPLMPAPLPRPPTTQPSTSHAPPVERPPSAGDTPAAAKRTRRATATAAANPVEIPEPRWAWEAEQNRIEAEKRMLALFERSVAAQETMVATLREIKEEIINMREDFVAALGRLEGSSDN